MFVYIGSFYYLQQSLEGNGKNVGLYMNIAYRSVSDMSKESQYSVKRDLVQCQKRPSTMSKET
jgi:hypothetical protein